MPTLVERDEAGVVTSTYITAVPERIDIIVRPAQKLTIPTYQSSIISLTRPRSARPIQNPLRSAFSVFSYLLGTRLV
jgi:hypothetical protein